MSGQKMIEIACPLYPRLPAGSVSGLRARGGFEVDLVCAKGVHASVKIQSLASEPLKARLGERVIELPTRRSESYRFGPNLIPVQ